jgi:probable rRNA maturation factor
MLEIDIQDRQSALAIDETRLAEAIRKVATDHAFQIGEVGIVVVDDPTIHQINRDHLQHDYPTDVISFVFTAEDGELEGEVIVSTDTAIREASDGGWSPQDELLLYVIHGMLHLVGMDDVEPHLRKLMRAAEAKYLAYFQLTPQQIELMAADRDEVV